MYLRKAWGRAMRGLSLLWTLTLVFVLYAGTAAFESEASALQLDDALALKDGEGYLFTLPKKVETAHPVAASTTTIYARKDNTLYESSGGSRSNGVGEHFFVGRNDRGRIRRGVVAFDVAGNIPAGSTVTDVTLVLHMSRSRASQVSIELRRLLADWGEGTSNAPGNEGDGASATDGDATWLHTSFNTGFWTTAGGDFSTVASAATSVGGTGFYTWASTSQLVTDVQTWLDLPATNFGWLLLGNETRSQTTKRFDTRENANQANRPALVVQYVPPPTLTVNYSDGAPGSFFTFTGVDFAASSTVTLTINGLTLGTVSTGDGGNLVFLLSTTDADEGAYFVTATATSSATAGFVLESGKAVRPQEGSGPIFDVPSGIALTEFIYLPTVLR